MAQTTLFKHSALCLITGMSVSGCQSLKPPPVPVAPIIEAPQFLSTNYPMMVKGQSFTIDAPWNDQQNLQQQQDTLLMSANEYEADGKYVHKYVKVEKIPDDATQYLLKSGLHMDTPEHNFNTFLQFTLTAHCKHIQSKLYCQYKAIDGLYSVDLPESISLKAEQTPEQMEKNEIATLSKLISRPLKITETFKTPLSLSQLKTKLVKQHFLVDAKKPNLYLSRLQYNYEIELSQEKIKKQYMVTANYYINPINIDAYHADYLTPANLAKTDLKKSLTSNNSLRQNKNPSSTPTRRSGNQYSAKHTINFPPNS